MTQVYTGNEACLVTKGIKSKVRRGNEDLTLCENMKSSIDSAVCIQFVLMERNSSI